MERYVRPRDADAPRLGRLLDGIVADPSLHARFLNTLARLEYVGVRKMLKSRRAERLDVAGLEHMLDETVHALRLKRAAIAVAPAAAEVETFAGGDTLAGDDGERYFQALDRRAEETLGDLPEDRRAEASYLLTSAAIEVRARAFYPIYEERLKAAGARVSVASILRDEGRHLAEMAEGLERRLPGWRARLEAVLDAERSLYDRFMAALEAEVLTASSRSAGTRAASSA